MRVRTIPLAGEAEAWDPAHPGPFAALAGDQYLGQEGDTALVRDAGGCVLHAHPGWLVIRMDGDPAVVFCSQRLSGERGIWAAL